MLLSIVLTAFVLTDSISGFNKLLKQIIKGVGSVKAVDSVDFQKRKVKKYEAHLKFHAVFLHEI